MHPTNEQIRAMREAIGRAGCKLAQGDTAGVDHELLQLMATTLTWLRTG